MRYILRNMHTDHDLLCFVVAIFHPYLPGLLNWHWGNPMIAPVPVKQPWKIWVMIIWTQQSEAQQSWVHILWYMLSMISSHWFRPLGDIQRDHHLSVSQHHHNRTVPFNARFILLITWPHMVFKCITTFFVSTQGCFALSLNHCYIHSCRWSFHWHSISWKALMYEILAWYKYITSITNTYIVSISNHH